MSAAAIDIGDPNQSSGTSRFEDHYRYDPRAVLGRGNFAEVYGCVRLSDRSEWAVKFVDLRRASTEPDVVRRLRAACLREANALAQLRHPHIMPVEDYGALDDGTLFLVMPKLPGGRTLDKVLSDSGGRLSADQAVRVGIQLGEALAYIHEREMVHRDVKPANVGIDADGGVRLLDFGLVKHLDDERGQLHSESSTVAGWGSFYYGAPEQFFDGDVGRWTDIYALGAVLYRTLAGQPPVRGRTLDEVLRSLNAAPPPLPPGDGRPRALDRVIMRCIEKRPTARPQHMDHVLRQLRDLGEGAPIVSAEPRRDEAALAEHISRVVRINVPRGLEGVQRARWVDGAETVIDRRNEPASAEPHPEALDDPFGDEPSPAPETPDTHAPAHDTTSKPAPAPEPPAALVAALRRHREEYAVLRGRFVEVEAALTRSETALAERQKANDALQALLESYAPPPLGRIVALAVALALGCGLLGFSLGKASARPGVHAPVSAPDHIAAPGQGQTAAIDARRPGAPPDH
jgi:serine/threonine-protein kinase